ncbi:hypothetical protein CFAEC_09680 [Corynebacterium faecale]|uniref:hypothetical protein n=1 Tax=Corynebacterium faecale TaxID=1758466 RepID=UPI0025B3DE28|nr:hypothetical protein [Corynebacterium faecale]WJY92753.1 hypothetical protein CFAEC_09680 [Corynebacterium faecale]
MTAPHQSTTDTQADLTMDRAAGLPTSGSRSLPEPAPVSKHNLYVLIGCTILATLMVIFGPEIYTLLYANNPFGF